MDATPADVIHMVHHLIEECILFKMSREECMDALSKHANINPIVTSTVWKGLERENKEFFDAYDQGRASVELVSTRLTNLKMPLDASQRKPTS